MALFYNLTSEEPKFPQDNLTLKALAKFYANLLFDFDHQEITFREDAIALGELLIHLAAILNLKNQEELVVGRGSNDSSIKSKRCCQLSKTK